jgi:hypothetical protein
MVTRAKTIKLADLTAVIDKAVEASAGRRLPGGTIIGRQIRADLAEKIDPKAFARDVTRAAQAAFPDSKLTPQVIQGPDVITCGFIIRPLAR